MTTTQTTTTVAPEGPPTTATPEGMAVETEAASTTRNNNENNRRGAVENGDSVLGVHSGSDGDGDIDESTGGGSNRVGSGCGGSNGDGSDGDGNDGGSGGSDGGGGGDDDSWDDPGAPTMREILHAQNDDALENFVQRLLSCNQCCMCRSLGGPHMGCRACGEDSGGYYTDEITREDIEYYLDLTERQFEQTVNG